MKQFGALLRKDSQPVRYLVVDDSVFARKNLIKMIEMFGGELAGEAGDGLTAIAEYNRIKPDIVLMDITMPQMEGIEAVERIVRQHADARIVMVSSVGYQENILCPAKGREAFRAEAGEAGSVVRDSPLCAQRRSERGGRAAGAGRGEPLMRMELIQPFINAADAVFAESLKGPTKIVDVEMAEDAYRRKGVAALILIKGDIEGRVILDLAPEVAVNVASVLAGTAMEASEQVVRETVCELANMVIGNSVTLLNDQGFHFKVFPPEVHMNEAGLAGSADTEALVICIETPCGDIFLNIAMRYLHRRRAERSAVPALD